jgi:histone-lysine N-methyltransferase SETMAR
MLKFWGSILRKRPGQQARGELLHHDNARPHTDRVTQERIQEIQWELLEHLHYSPDLAPSDFHLFSQLKISLVADVSLLTKSLKRRCGND